MQKLIAGLLACLVVSAGADGAEENSNPCIEVHTPVCTASPSVSFLNTTNSVTVCVNGAVSLCGVYTNNPGTITTYSTYMDCSTDVSAETIYASILSTWWVATVGSSTLTGSGLCPTFNANTVGSGSIKLFVRYQNDYRCDGTGQTITITNIIPLTVQAENGPHTSSWSCLQQGSTASAGAIEFTNMVVCVGEPISPPAAYGATFNSGSKRRYINYDCSLNQNLNHWETNAVIYTASAVYFDPPIPSFFASPQTNTYTAKIDGVPVGGVCSTISNIVLGTVTIKAYSSGDSDYDGFSDCQEIKDGTDPYNPAAVMQMWLGYWSFNNTNWIGEFGQEPLVQTNLLGIPGRNLGAVQINSSASSILSYRTVETNGWANLNCGVGTVRFWFRPSWASMTRGGSGPQAAGRLIEVGQIPGGGSTDWWSLVLNPAGTQLSFVTATNGQTQTNFNAAIAWSSEEWHQVALTYNATNSALYIDGQAVVANGLGVTRIPSATVRSNGFRIGSDLNGANQAKGRFDDLETFNYVQDVSTIANVYAWRMNLTAPNTNYCVLRPITVPNSIISTTQPASTITIQRGTGPGNYSWVEGNKYDHNNNKILAVQLTNETGFAFSRSDNPADKVVSVGTLISGVPGKRQASGIRASLNWLIATETTITLPVWSTYSEQGANLEYRVTNYAQMKLLAYDADENDINGKSSSSFTFKYLGNSQCDGTNNVAPVVNAGPDLVTCLSSGVALNGYVRDDNRPAPANLTFAWSKVSGPGDVTFTNASMTNASASFNAPGNYRLQLFATDGQLSAIDTVDVTVWTNTTAVGPTNLARVFGDSALFSTIAAGTGPFSYKWTKNSQLLIGQTNNTLLLTNVSYQDSGTYQVEVTGRCTSWTNAATLVVPNLAPEVAIIQPTNNQSFFAPAAITLLATASDPDGTVSQVVFFRGTNNIGTGTLISNQYTLGLSNVAAGAYTFTAVATDNLGLSRTSAPVAVNVNNQSIMSVVITTPAANSVFVAPATIPVTATVANGNNVQQVEFFANDVRIGQAPAGSTGPYVFTWIGVPAISTNYVLTARATDAFGQATSLPVPVRVVPPVSVDAGVDRVVLLSGSAVTITLDGTITGGAQNVTSEWTQVSGLATAQFTSATNTNALVTFTSTGIYQLLLSGGDGYSWDSDVMTISVVTNRPPIVDAGPNRIIAPGSTALLSGSVQDDGLPMPPNLSSWWSVITGPTAGVTFTNPNSPVTLATNFPVTGVYTLRLSATDGMATNSSDMRVTVAVPSSRTYTLNADFAEGALVNVNFDEAPHQLQLNYNVTPFPYVWVACSARNTAVRIDANTGQILGEYRTAPDSRTGPDPSRTTVDKFGNVWIANRSDHLEVAGLTRGSITRVALVIGGTRGYKTNDLGGTNYTFVASPNGQWLRPPFWYSTAVDRDGDGLIKTSIGLDNVLPWGGTNTANDLGGVSLADDECIINFTRVNSYGTRTIAIDRNNDLWVGGTGNHLHEKVNGITGEVIPNTAFVAPNSGYGGLIDGNGVLWSANSLVRFDINRRFNMQVNPPVVIDNNYVGESIPTFSYGVSIDPKTGYIWCSYSGSAIRVAPDGSSFVPFPNPDGIGAGGIAVDSYHNVWVASHSGGNAVAHFRTDGTFVGNVDFGCSTNSDVYGPTGVAVDSNGRIWTADLNSRTATRIDPNRGPRMLNGKLDANGYPLGEVDLRVNLDSGKPGIPNATPYNYSDMTGFISLGATEPSGIWQVVHDSGTANQSWGVVKWNSSEPTGTAINVEVRAAGSYAQLTHPTNVFRKVTNNNPFTGVVGRYLEVRTTLSHKLGVESTPILYDLTVSSGVDAVTAEASTFALDDRAAVFENSTTNVIDVLANDAVPANSTLTISKVSPAKYGTVQNTGTNLIYRPQTNFFGKDQFTYTAVDGQGGVGRAVVTISVGHVAPAPVVNTFAPIARPDTNLFINGNIVDCLLYVMANDEDTNTPPAAIFLNSVTSPSHGTARIGPCGIYYTPNRDYYGPDSFVYTIRNSHGRVAQAKVTLTVVGQPTPIACGTTINTTLALTNSAISTHRRYTYCQTYTFVGNPSQAVTIALGGSFFYGQTTLYDANGVQVATGSSFEGDSHPIVYVPRTTNVYSIEVDFGPEAGYGSNYELSLSCTNADAPHLSLTLGTNIVSNGSMIDFGVTRVGRPVSASLTITNFGSTNLVISSARFSRGGSFTLTNSALVSGGITIGPNSSSNVTVRFDAFTVGETNDVLWIDSNDADYPNYQVNLTGRANRTNTVAPTISITNPVPNSIFIASDLRDWESRIRITANVTPGPGARIVGVNYFAYLTNGSRIQIGQQLYPDWDDDAGEYLSNRYTFIWNVDVPPGIYKLTADTLDDSGLSGTSSEIPITVLHRATNAPELGILFFGTNNLSSDSLINFGVAPTNNRVQVQLTLTNRGAGTLLVTNFAFNSSEFYVTNVPTLPISLAAGAKTNVTVAFASTTPGTFENREFYIDSNDQGLFGPYNGNQQPAGRMRLLLTGTAAAVGTPPVIVLTDPASNAVFTASNNITLKATATASSGASVSSVEFYAAVTGGYIKLGSGGHQGGGVYQCNSSWTPAAGAYSLFAVVVDSNQRAASSPLVPITVLLRPTNSPILQVFLSQTNRVLNWSTIDYRVTQVGSPVTAIVTLSNAGNALLTISKMSFSNDIFSVSNAVELPISIPAGSATNVSLVFNASTFGEAKDVFVIYNNDIASHPFYITNIGRANPPNSEAPSVVLTQPLDNSQFAFPADITISATATCPTNSQLASIDIFSAGPTNTSFIGRISAGANSTNLSGTIVWSRPAAGAYTLKAVARDKAGLMGESTNLCRVRVTGTPEDPTNAPPSAHDDVLVITTCPGNCSTYAVDVLANDSDPNNDALLVTSVTYTGSLGRVRQEGNKILFTPNPNYWGFESVYYTVSDNKGGEDGAWLDLDVRLVPVPSVSIVAPKDDEYIELPTNVAARNLLLQAYALANNSNGVIKRVDFYSGDAFLGSATNGIADVFSFNWQTPPSGNHTITADAFDNEGQSNISEPIHIYIAGKPGNTLPIAAITNLAALQTNAINSLVYPIVTNGIAEVRGHARDTDAGDIVRYKLMLYSTDGVAVGNITPNAEADGYRTGSDNNGILATNVDLSLYDNGVYDIVLTVFDGWETSSDTARILLDSQLKVGNFSFSVQDVSIPVSGIPLTVTRTYNSLKQRSGEFGYCWTYTLNDLDVQLDEYREDTSDITLAKGQFSLRVGGGRDVTLTLPDGRRVTFQFYFDGPTTCGSGFLYDNYCYEPKWKAPPGVYYTLTAVGDVLYNGLNNAWNNDGSTGFENYDFPGFVLTAPDGTKYILEREDEGEHFFDSGFNDDFYAHTYGKPRLTQIIQPDGNRIEFFDNEIRHYNPSNILTRSLFFEHRNGLITAIRDPNSGSNGLPVVKYSYDEAKGNLTQVFQLTDRNANGGLGAYSLTTYEYTNRNYPHFITAIIDPRGIPVARNEYYDDGRLKAVVDADGKRTECIHNLDNRVEITIDRAGRTNTFVYDLRGNVIAQTNALGGVTRMTYDDKNNLKSLTDACTNTIFFSYDQFGNRTNEVDALNRTNTYIFDPSGRLVAHIDSVGNVTTNRYDTAGNVTNTLQLDLNGSIISESSSFFEAGLLKETRNGNVTAAKYEYDGFANLIATVNADGVTNFFSYDGNGNVTNSGYVWYGSGTNVTVATTTEYDAAGRVIRTIDSNQNITRTFYNSLGKVDFAIDKFGNTNRFSYDARGNLIESIDSQGLAVRTVFDEDGRPILTADRNQITGTRTYYDALGRVTNVVRLKDVKIELQNDPKNAGQLRSVIASAGTALSSKLTEYLANGWVKTQTGVDGKTTSYEYFPDGQLKKVTDALTNVTSYLYDPAGRRAVAVDALQHTNRFQYDAIGRLTKTLFADQSFISNRFNLFGQKIAQVDQAGVPRTFGYDTVGHLTSVTNAPVVNADNLSQMVNPVWSYDYDQYGHLTVVTDPKQRATTNQFDSLGRPVTRRLPMGQTETNVYNAFGQLYRKIDFKGQKTEFVYDRFGRRKAKFFFNTAASVPTEAVCYQYNQLGQLWRIIERRGPGVTTNTCDGYAAVIGLNTDDSSRTFIATVVSALRRNAAWPLTLAFSVFILISIPPQVKRVLTFFYMRGGWRLSQLNAYNKQRRVYLPSGWLRAVGVCLAIVTATMDPAMRMMNTASAGTCAIPASSTDDNERVTEFAYDLEGRVEQINCPEGVINYGYDLTTGRHNRTCTANSEAEYDYDELGRLKTVHVVRRNNLLVDETTTYTYTAVGSRASITLPNGILTTYQYDNLNRLTNLTHSLGGTNLLAQYSYGLHVTGRRTNAVEITKREDNSYATNWLTWAYDGMYRLTNEVSISTLGGGGTYTNRYLYDVVGNRVQKINIQGSSTNSVDSSYNANDQLLAEVFKVNGSVSSTNLYGYDANGSLVAKTNSSQVVTYGYNLANKLSSVAVNGVTNATYLYNDAGIRVRSTSFATTHYLVDPNNHTGYAQVLEELATIGGLPNRSYVIGDDVLAQSGSTTNASYLLYDGHGSTRQLVTSTTVSSQYNYDAYGQTMATSTTISGTSLRYCGEQFDDGLNMYNLRARFYDPASGRFNAVDTFGGNTFDPQSLHKYAYCHGDPINGTDPTGNFTLTELLVGLLIIAVVVGLIFGSMAAIHKYSHRNDYAGSTFYYENTANNEFKSGAPAGLAPLNIVNKNGTPVGKLSITYEYLDASGTASIGNDYTKLKASLGTQTIPYQNKEMVDDPAYRGAGFSAAFKPNNTAGYTQVSWVQYKRGAALDKNTAWFTYDPEIFGSQDYNFPNQLTTGDFPGTNARVDSGNDFILIMYVPSTKEVLSVLGWSYKVDWTGNKSEMKVYTLPNSVVPAGKVP